MTLIKRLVKGAPLTFAEGDANLDYLENLSKTISGSYATTGSNEFTGNQVIFGDLTVFGTSSISYVTSSQVYIGTNIITLNTDTPSVRFGGVAVFDSGSSGLTGSILWDSQKNHWIYTNPSGSSYSSGMLISGPRNTGSIGDEQGITLNSLVKGQGGDHITSSVLFEDGTIFNIGIDTVITGSLTVTGVVSASISGLVDSASYAMMSDTASYAMMVDEMHTSSYSTYAETSSISFKAVSSSYALSASNADFLDGYHKSILATTGSNIFSGSQSINGDLFITGTGSLSIQGLPIGTGGNKISSNIAIGVNTLFNNVNTSNIRNIAMGDFSYFSLASGSNNVGIGLNTGFSLLIGTNNSSFGSRSGTDLISGSNNTFIGSFAGSNLTTGSNNTFIGQVILPQTSSVNNTVIIADGSNNQRLVINNLGLAIFSDSIYASGSLTTSGSLTVQKSTAILSQVSESYNFADDNEASGSGIPLGGLYHTSGTIKIRLV